MSRIREELAPYCQGKRWAETISKVLTQSGFMRWLLAPSIAEIIEHPTTLELIDQLLPPNYLPSAGPFSFIQARRPTVSLRRRHVACPSSSPAPFWREHHLGLR